MHCGEGIDHVLADQFDQVDNDCEHVDRQGRHLARPGRRRGREPGRARGLTTTVGAGTVARPCQPTTSSADVRVAPSILASDFARLGEQVEAVMDAGARVIHVDVMDGHFVPPDLDRRADRRRAARPRARARRRAGRAPHGRAPGAPRSRSSPSAGADSITVHWEATPHVHYALKAVREAGLHAGLALNPATPADVVAGWSRRLDHVLCMTVNPGWGGQAYIETSTAQGRAPARAARPGRADRGGRRHRRGRPPAPPARPARRCSWRARRSSAPRTPPPPTARSPPRRPARLGSARDRADEVRASPRTASRPTG